MPTPRHGVWATVIGNRIYIPGGGVVQGFGASNINEVFIVDPEVEIPLEITAIELSGSNVLLKFRTQRNHTYLVERKDDLLMQSWTPLSNRLPGTGGIVTVQDTNASTLPQRFYRVREL
jgi:hypothetical protein